MATSARGSSGGVYTQKREPWDPSMHTGYSWTIKDLSVNEIGCEQAPIWSTSPFLS